MEGVQGWGVGEVVEGMEVACCLSYEQLFFGASPQPVVVLTVWVQLRKALEDLQSIFDCWAPCPLPRRPCRGLISVNSDCGAVHCTDAIYQLPDCARELRNGHLYTIRGDGQVYCLRTVVLNPKNNAIQMRSISCCCLPPFCYLRRAAGCSRSPDY